MTLIMSWEKNTCTPRPFLRFYKKIKPKLQLKQVTNINPDPAANPGIKQTHKLTKTKSPIGPKTCYGLCKL